jgi:hypothetical protein
MLQKKQKVVFKQIVMAHIILNKMKHLVLFVSFFYLCLLNSCKVVKHDSDSSLSFKFSVGEFDFENNSAKKIKLIILGLDFNIGFKNFLIEKSTLKGEIKYDDPERTFRRVTPKMIYIYKFDNFKSLKHLELIDSIISGNTISINVKRNNNIVFLSVKFGPKYCYSGEGNHFQFITIK